MLERLSTSYDSSPIFLKNYRNLVKGYKEGKHNSLILELRYFDSEHRGYIFGCTNASRDSIISDILFIYIFPLWRNKGYAKLLVQSYEDRIKLACNQLGVQKALIRIVMKHCIENSYDFWIKNEFEGSKSSILTKTLVIF